MKGLKNIFVGFLVSFIGSIPLGYLNIIGFEIYSKFGIKDLIFYLLGVVSVEVFVIYFTLVFAEKLVNNKKLMKVVDYFSVVFLIILGYSFYAHSNQTTSNHNDLEQYITYSPFLIGLVLNCVNFLQLPFWTGWNLYLMNGNYIAVETKLKYYYVAGTLIGTFLGMLALVLILNTLTQNTTFFSKYVMSVIIPLFFIVLAFIQMYKVYKKYYKK
jgi:TRAP-type C4-dicarboxylate transport system permease small subunit